MIKRSSWIIWGAVITAVLAVFVVFVKDTMWRNACKYGYSED